MIISWLAAIPRALPWAQGGQPFGLTKYHWLAACGYEADAALSGEGEVLRWFLPPTRRNPARAEGESPMAGRRRGTGRRKVGRKKRRMRSRIRHRK